MPLRMTMGNLIGRVRLLINDTSTSPVFGDQDVQDVLDEGRQDAFNMPLRPAPTYTGATISYLDYLSDVGGWEDGMVLKQFLTVDVTSLASSIEPIAGRFHFSQSVLPPVMITGKIYDVYRAAADLLERQAAQWSLSFNLTANGQTLHRSQAAQALLKLADQHRRKQRPRTISLVRTDLLPSDSAMRDSTIDTYGVSGPSLGAREIDYMSSGNVGG